jgi:hypothetical protein
MNIFSRIYAHSLKYMNKIILNSGTCNSLLSVAESKWGVPCSDIVHRVSTTRLSGGKTAAARVQERV